MRRGSLVGGGGWGFKRPDIELWCPFYFHLDPKLYGHLSVVVLGRSREEKNEVQYQVDVLVV